MRSVLRPIFWCAVVGSLLCGGSSVALAKCKVFLKFKTIKTAHFAIHYYPEETAAARQLVSISEEAYDIVTRQFGIRPKSVTEVILLNHHDTAQGFSSPVPYNLMVLRTTPPLADSPQADYDQWLKSLFVHEYTHIVNYRDTHFPATILKPIFGTFVTPNLLTPAWLREGVASYVETSASRRGPGRSAYTDMILRTDILRQQFLHVDQMAGTGFAWPAEVAPTVYGERFWEYLSAHYGADTVARFSHKYGSSLAFFSLNRKAKRVFHKTFYELWREWKESLEAHYMGVKGEIEKTGVTPGAAVLASAPSESAALPTFSPDGQSLAYVAGSKHRATELRLHHRADGTEKILVRGKDIQQMSFAPDGSQLFFTAIGTTCGFYQYSDLHALDLRTGKDHALTHGARARDADVSPDGTQLAAVLQLADRSQLAVYDLAEQRWTVLADAEQFDHPRWLPDGHSIVVSQHHDGQRDVVIMNLHNHTQQPITADAAFDDHPVVDRVHGAIYFSSDRSGISNIYRYDLRTRRTVRVTNVLTGAFAPTIAPDGTLVFQYYNGTGFELRQLAHPDGHGVSASSAAASATTPTAWSMIAASSEPTTAADDADPLAHSKKYNSLRRILPPHFVLPKISLIDGSLFASLTTLNFDPLQRHFWKAGVSYRNDNKFVGPKAEYSYKGLLMPLTVGYDNYTVNYGNVFNLGNDYYEEVKRGYVGISTPPFTHQIALNYFFENRSANRGLPAGAVLQTLGHYAGLAAQYAYHNTSDTPASISPESGQNVTVNYEVSKSVFGATKHMEQQVVWGDARTYIRMPFAAHHVLALRAAGGMAFGDLFIQGNFGLGGGAGESPYSAVSSRLFTLRGLPLLAFSRDRAWVASAEYRLPLWPVQRGPGTFPISVNKTHLAIFADLGDAYDRGEPRFRPLLGLGAEVRGDLILGYRLPLTMRLGFARIFTHRDRLVGLSDGLTGGDARYGTVILNIGTSF